MKSTVRGQVDYRYISKRLVRQIVQQQESTRRSRWKLSGVSMPWASIAFQKDQIDWENDFEFRDKATAAVKDVTRTLSQGWGDYIRAELDMTMGFCRVSMGWKNVSPVEIAVMKAVVDDPESGRIYLGLFGSVSNYRFRKSVVDDLGDIPSDVDGLYGILDRAREEGDPEIEDYFLDRDIGQSPEGRVDTALRLLNGDRFAVRHSGRFDVLFKSFVFQPTTDPEGFVILGAPVWVASTKTH